MHSVERAKEMARAIEKKLAELGVSGHISDISIGPYIITFYYKAGKGQRIRQIASLEDDLSALFSIDVRAVIERGLRLEVPRVPPLDIPLKDINPTSGILIGLDREGLPYTLDLDKVPHLLIGGTTGAGKSNLIHVLIRGLKGKARLFGIDFKRVELGMYKESFKVAVEENEVKELLSMLLSEMDSRYKRMEEMGVNNYRHLSLLPWICIIDEYAELKFLFKEAEKTIIRIAQLGRASGIHLIVSTQRPDSRIISPIIKANFPFRIVFRLAGAGDEKVMDCKGARRLIPPGDALANLKGEWERIHVPYFNNC